MGKTNKANRTKGNTRPSSSSHSALLLDSSGKPLSGFIGFGGLEKDVANYVPVTGQQSETPDGSVDSDFRMAMRKLLKRDAVTRLKALQEFGEYCVEKDQDIVKNVLPFWPRLFNKMAVDTDRRIREASHQANGKLFSKVGRDMAPYLKNIMGVWLLGQCDPHPPAASAAISAFAHFTPQKQGEALLFCKSEIFAYFKDNLFEQTAKSLSEPHLSSPEEMENKYNLVISSTLQALKLFVASSGSKCHTIGEDLGLFVSDNKFWKFAKHKEPMIRGSWYALISSLCHHAPKVFESREKKLMTAVFTCLSESDPVVAPFVWEAALSIVVNFEGCWEEVDVNKVVLPQLWSLLREGGKGNARILFPCLLPFLSRLPFTLLQHGEFQTRFFSCFRRSLMLDKVKASAMECDAIISAFVECLQYICFTKLDSENAGPALLEKIIVSEVIPIMEMSLITSKSSPITTSKFYPLLGSLIQKTEQRCKESKNKTAFSRVLDTFWQHMLSIMHLYLDMEEKAKENTTLYLQYFYNSVINGLESNILEEKKSVRFQDENEDAIADAPLSSPSQSFSKSVYSKDTKSFIYIAKVCQLLFERLDKECNICYIKLLEEIIGTVYNRKLLEEVVILLGKDSTLLKDFFQQFIVDKWNAGYQQNRHLCAESDWVTDNKNEIFSTCLVDFTFGVCSCVTLKEASSILDVCCETSSSNLVNILKKTLNEKETPPFAEQWLNSSQCWSNEMVKYIQECVTAVKNDRTSLKGLPESLKLCLSNSCLVELFLKQGTFEEIFSSLLEVSNQLFGSEEKHIIYYTGCYICEIVTIILENTQSFWKIANAKLLILMLFEQCIYFTKQSDKETLGPILEKMWKTALCTYVQHSDESYNDEFLLKMAETFKYHILNVDTRSQMEAVLDMCKVFVTIIYNGVYESNADSFTRVITALLPTEDDWITVKKGLHVDALPSLLNNSLFCHWTEYETDHGKSENQVTRLGLATICFFSILSLNDEIANCSRAHILQQIPHMIWFRCFYLNSRFLREELLGLKFESRWNLLISCLLPDEQQFVADKLLKLSLLFGTDWIIPLCFFLNYHPNVVDSSWTDSLFLSNSKHRFITVQALIPILNLHLQTNVLQQANSILKLQLDLSTMEYYGPLGIVCCLLHYNPDLLSHSVFTTLMNLAANLQNSRAIDKQIQVQTVFFILHSIPNKMYVKECWHHLINLLDSLIKKCEASYLNDSHESLWCAHQAAATCSKMVEVHQLDSQFSIDEEYYVSVMKLFINIIDVYQNRDSDEWLGTVLQSVEEAMDHIPSEKLLHLCLDGSDLVTEITENSVFSKLLKQVSCKPRSLQFVAHRTIIRVIENLPKTLTLPETLVTEDDQEEEDAKLPSMLLMFVDSLSFLTEVVESMLGDIPFGDLCTIIPYTDSYNIAMAYMLVWSEVLTLISCTPTQIRFKYTCYLEEKELLSKFFNNIFCLLPHHPGNCLSHLDGSPDPCQMDFHSLFNKLHHLPRVLHSNDIHFMAFYVFVLALQRVPASIRCWWNNLDRKTSDVVNDFTTKYVSHRLCAMELKAVHDGETMFKDMVVQARIPLGEVVATYTLDERTLELVIRLPPNYPLGRVQLELRRVVAQKEWRDKLMQQLSMLLMHQNGSLLDGLHMWNRNLEKKFEGVEECMICFQILDLTSQQLPKISCQICRKKFHSVCLYKWFRTSNKNSCPLCRHEFVIR